VSPAEVANPAAAAGAVEFHRLQVEIHRPLKKQRG